jgi:uroporphyrinogen-III synthase
MTQSGLKPLDGKRILLTNPVEGSEALLRQLAAWGASVEHIPLIQVQPIPFAFESAPGSYDWLFFTSKNAVNAFYSQAIGQDEQWTFLAVATVGPATAQAVRQFGIHPRYVAPEFDADSAAQDFARQYAGRSCRCLWPCGNLASPTLKTRLEQAGMQVTPLKVYETRERRILPEREAALLAQPYDLLIFTSPSAVRAYSALQKQSSALGRIACIGPRTAHAARQLLATCDIQASSYTFDGLAAAIERFYCPNSHTAKEVST